MIDWGGKLIKIDIYKDNRYTSTSKRRGKNLEIIL